MKTNNIYRFVKNKDEQDCERTDVVSGVSVWFERVLKSLPFGTYTISINRKTDSRSLDQNALMWKWFECIAIEWTEVTGTPYSKQDVHDYYCTALLKRHVDVPVFGGGQTMVVGSSSKLSTSEMTEFLNRIQADVAAEWGIKLPTREDSWYEEWCLTYNL